MNALKYAFSGGLGIYTIDMLKIHPERGHKPPELKGLRSPLQQVIIPPYRILYQEDDNRVVIIAVFDGRRDVKAHLLSRNAH